MVTCAVTSKLPLKLEEHYIYVVSTRKGKRKAGWKSTVAHTQNSGSESGGQ
jgi:hypothetical protein